VLLAFLFVQFISLQTLNSSVEYLACILDSAQFPHSWFVTFSLSSPAAPTFGARYSITKARNRTTIAALLKECVFTYLTRLDNFTVQLMNLD